jgi:hypothetical protein
LTNTASSAAAGDRAERTVGPGPGGGELRAPAVSANGTVQFMEFPDCGSSNATWEAVKR